MIVVSLLLGVAAVVVAGKWINQQVGIDASRVVVAAQDINVGTRLTADLMKTIDWPSGSIPTGSFNDLTLLDSRVVKVNLQRGEPLLEGKLAPEGTAGGLSGVIPDGKRAITVRVNDVVGVAGFALPGNLVDILVNIKEDYKNPVSKIVLEQILVLAVAQDLGRDETKPKVVNAVTLEVTPEQAERLDLARSVGTLSLVLRNQIDKSFGSTDGIRTHDLLGTKMATVEAKPEDKKIVYKSVGTPKPSVEIIRGLEKTNAR
ncbi:Flp pilus assembly protein CpaB [Nitrosomonas sp. Nm58]|jgi:pilus assembly protein CpaB|uniref:Flp pilus assembly protein CpaB n=1 Tax=Nitrosomonas sp. Nm58 TaxID=200126 RepID=UPI00210B1A72|nr:Flp pilus assembly protein CpaB [Nitrosomonas sp. Nm58]